MLYAPDMIFLHSAARLSPSMHLVVGSAAASEVILKNKRIQSGSIAENLD